MNTNIKVLLGFLFGAIMMLVWMGFCSMASINTSLILPSPMWAKMIIGGFIGIPLLLIATSRDTNPTA